MLKKGEYWPLTKVYYNMKVNGGGKKVVKEGEYWLLSKVYCKMRVNPKKKGC
jgi:hypothetical protein